ncbi:hypothetical protein AB0E67_26545 [Streptomyces sp. NPDC032161]|uniref:hypothetical protein n=1 Tax=unclassified Streptomyces TaxID=2593676 RepID=UPI0033C4EB83
MSTRTGGGARPAVAAWTIWSGRPIAASAITQFMLVLLAVEIAGIVELAFPAPAPPDDPAVVLLMVPFLLCFGAPFFLVASLLVVLPTVAAACWASARFTGREVWWWVPATALVPATVGAAVAGIAWHPAPGSLFLCWTVGAALLTATALVARGVVLRRRRLRGVVGWCVVAAVAVYGIGAGLYGTGLVTEYRPPKVDTARLAGTWTDGGGGTLRLAADGTAHADALADPEEARSEPAKLVPAKHRCSGRGTWSYEAGDSTTWGQRVRLWVGGCPDYDAIGGWRIGGTPDRIEINYEYGDPDSPDWYTLTTH